MPRSNTAKIIPFTKPEPRKQKGFVPDNVFFHKSQVSIGTELILIGRNAIADALEGADASEGALLAAQMEGAEKLASVWVVFRIDSHALGKVVGEFRAKRVKGVQFLNDVLHLRNVHTGETRTAHFSYLSYTAIWQLKKQ